MPRLSSTLQMGSPEQFANHECRIFASLASAGFAPDVIFDVGAANGTWSMLVSEVFPDAAYQLFEPLATFVPLFQENLRGQLAAHPKFRLHAIALGAENGDVTMRVHADGYSSTILDMGAHPEYQQRHTVPQYRLDDYVRKFDLRVPDVIKLDVQGAEMAILKHAPQCLAHAQLVFAETWFERGYGPDTPLVTELRDFLETHGFVLAELGHRFYDQDHRLYGCDAFFLKRPFLEGLRGSLPAGPW